MTVFSGVAFDTAKRICLSLIFSHECVQSHHVCKWGTVCRRKNYHDTGAVGTVPAGTEFQESCMEFFTTKAMKRLTTAVHEISVPGVSSCSGAGGIP